MGMYQRHKRQDQENTAVVKGFSHDASRQSFDTEQMGDHSSAASTLEDQAKAAARPGFDLGQVNILRKGVSLAAPPPSSPLVQAKLTVGQPNDQYEQEADTVAQTVVQQIASPHQSQQQSGPQPLSPITQSVMNRPVQRDDGVMSGQTSHAFESQVNQSRHGGSALAPSVRGQMESAMGADFSGVKIHHDANADQLSRSIQAKAFTTGQDVFFRQGEYNPSSRDGQELLAHELTHVVQQKGQALQRTTDTIQRDDYPAQGATDADFDYGDDTSETAINQKVMLKKPKALYVWNGLKKTKLKTLTAGSFVTFEQKNPAVIFTSWTKVKTGDGTVGWINSKGEDSAAESGDLVGHEDAAVIMPNGFPTIEDIKQRMFGDCFLLAALSSLVERHPGFIRHELFQTDPTMPQQQHTIRFHRIADIMHGMHRTSVSFVPEDVTVDNTVLKLKTDRPTSLGEIPAGSNYGSAGVQDWPAIVEKAFARWPGKDSAGSVSPLEAKTSLQAGGHSSTAIMFLTGDGHYRYQSTSSSLSDWDKGTRADELEADNPGKTRESLLQQAETELRAENREDLKNEIMAALVDPSHMGIAASSKEAPPAEWLANNPRDGDGGAGEPKAGGIVFGHAYSVVWADANHIELRNPWGQYSRVNGTVEKNEAVSVLTWPEFFQTFKAVSLKGR